MLVSSRFQRLRCAKISQASNFCKQTRICQAHNMNHITAADIAAPPVNRDMKILDRSFFKQTVDTSALTVFDPRNVQPTRARLMQSRDFLSSSTIRAIFDDEHIRGAKCLLLRPHVKASDPSTWSETWSQIVHNGVAKVQPYKLTLTYDDWKMSDILDAVLPPISEDDEQNPNGFAQVGHVAHVNLRDQFLPYKNFIGQVLLDKNPIIKTVINKIRNVGTESAFRTFAYEVLAGPDDLNVTVHHSNCEFQFDFSKVYWNTRNGHEHERLIGSFKEGDVVCDVMAGVGPFAVPAGKKRVWVWANDLNPACYEALCKAIEKNKVSSFVQAFQLDGAEFIRLAVRKLLYGQRTWKERPKHSQSRAESSVKQTLTQTSPAKPLKEMSEPRTFDHFVMNLPATAIEFLHAFKGIYHRHEKLFAPPGGRKLPMIHVYTFQARKDTEEEEQEELRQRLSHFLDFELSEEDDIELHRARLVAPNKLYYCASFRLPAKVAFATPPNSTDELSQDERQDSETRESQLPETPWQPFLKNPH